MTAPADPALEWAAEVWRATPALRSAGPLDAFVRDAHRRVAAHLTPPPGWDADGAHRPLLPAQRAVAHRLCLAERPYGPSREAEQDAADRTLPPATTHRRTERCR